MEILNVLKEPSWLLALGIITALAGLIGGSFLVYDGEIGKACCCVAVLFIGIFICILSCNSLSQTKYEVLIKDNSAYEQLLEKYEVVDQRGRIWVVKEKNIK